MRNPLSKMITEMEPSGIRRFFDVASTMDNVISLGVGEPDFDTPWHIREEGIYSLEKGRTFYTSNAGLLPLRKEVCTYLKRRFALSYDSDEAVRQLILLSARCLIRGTRLSFRSLVLCLMCHVLQWQEACR